MNSNPIEIFETATSFFDEIDAFQFSLDQIDLKDKKSKNNLEQLKQSLLKSNIPFPYSKDFVKIDLETNKMEAIHFIEKFLGSNTGKALQTLPIEKQTMNLFDAATLFCYNCTQRKISASKIVLFRTDLSYTSLSLIHENTHILFNDPAPQKGFHIHYNELCPILMELIGATQLSFDPNLLSLYMNIRLKTLQDHFLEYINGDKLKNIQGQFSLPIQYSIHNSYTYMISTIYAFRLFELYQENPIAIQNTIRNILTHHITIESALQELNVSLKELDTINAIQKVLEKYKK